MPRPPPGLDDLPLTNELARELVRLDASRFGVETAAVDPAEAGAFARHLAAVVRQVLADVDGEDRATRQAQPLDLFKVAWVAAG